MLRSTRRSRSSRGKPEAERIFGQAREVAHRLLAVRPRSRRELADLLGRRGIPSETVEELLEKLSQQGLIDDAKFAEVWVRGRLTLQPSGAVRLRQELLGKGVSREIIDRAIRSALAERGESELELALAVARSRAARHRGLPRVVQHRRLGALLQRRGFSAGVIAQVLRSIVTSEDHLQGADAEL